MPDHRRRARVFAALGDETRLALVDRLGGGRRSITQLARGSTVTRQAVSKHLRVLEHAGLVRGVREGRRRVYALEPGGLGAVREYLESFSKRWGDARGRLKTFVEIDP